MEESTPIILATRVVNRSCNYYFLYLRWPLISVGLIFLKISFIFNTFSKNNAICTGHINTMASVEDQDIRGKEDAIAEVKALKKREYAKGVTRCCHEEFIKP